MGNRAVITTKRKDIGVYLHWNGGRSSVEAFLTYCKIKGFRSPENDNYGWARLCQVISNFLGGDLSIGIDRYENLDTMNGDNGVYVIENWNIVDRYYFDGEEQNDYPLKEGVIIINNCQPVRDQLTKEEIDEWFNKHKFRSNSQGVCPVCDGDNLDYDGTNIDGMVLNYSYTCRDCGTVGIESYDLVFFSHAIDGELVSDNINDNVEKEDN